MSSTRGPISERPISLGSTMKPATNLLLASTLAAIACCLLSTLCGAQTAQPLGKLTISGNTPYSCPSGWYFYNNGANSIPMSCFDATISCTATQNMDDIGLTFGWLNPAGIVPNVTQALGTIVLFNGGGGGPLPGNFNFADSYFKAGYEVVQVAFAEDWEQTFGNFGTGDVPNIQNAACRPATFLNYIYSNANFFPAVSNAYSKAGFCAHGLSAGSAAIAYSLAYYGAYKWLDNVELVSGPVLSDVKQGCQVPNANPVTVCGLTNYNGGQYGCQLGTGGSTWTLDPTYIQGAQNAVTSWTNASPSCANAMGQNTSSENQAWLNQSIVDQSTGGSGQPPVPTFYYPGTAMSGWLCRSVVNIGDPPYNCAANGNNSAIWCPNNSSPQGQIFYANIGASNPPPNYGVYAVDNCQHSEGVEEGNVPGFDPPYFQGTITGSNAVTYDMVGYAPAQLGPQCVRRSH